jgi:hypothetical protein
MYLSALLSWRKVSMYHTYGLIHFTLPNNALFLGSAKGRARAVSRT